jgi:hypothetical protein
MVLNPCSRKGRSSTGPAHVDQPIAQDADAWPHQHSTRAERQRLDHIGATSDAAIDVEFDVTVFA